MTTATRELLVCPASTTAHDPAAEAHEYLIISPRGTNRIVACDGCKGCFERMGAELITDRRTGPRLGAGARA